MNWSNWSNWSDFVGMGGYALYVWGAFAAVLGALAGEQLALHRRNARAAALAAGGRA